MSMSENLTSDLISIISKVINLSSISYPYEIKFDTIDINAFHKREVIDLNREKNFLLKKLKEEEIKRQNEKGKKNNKKGKEKENGKNKTKGNQKEVKDLKIKSIPAKGVDLKKAISSSSSLNQSKKQIVLSKNKQISTNKPQLNKPNQQKDEVQSKGNKGIDTFFKNLKENKENEDKKIIKRVTFKEKYLQKFGLFFVIDISNRIKLREGVAYQKEYMKAYYEMLDEIIYNKKEDDNKEMYMQNLKESIIIYENLLELSIQSGTSIEDEVIDILINIKKYSKESLMLINILYIIFPYRERYIHNKEIRNLLIEIKSDIEKENEKESIQIDSDYIINYSILVLSLITNSDLSSFLKCSSYMTFTLSNQIENDINKFKSILKSIRNTWKSNFLFETIKNSIFQLNMKTTKQLEVDLKLYLIESSKLLGNEIKTSRFQDNSHESKSYKQYITYIFIAFINIINNFNKNFVIYYSSIDNLNNDLIEIIDYIKDLLIIDIIDDVCFDQGFLIKCSPISEFSVNDSNCDYFSRNLQINIYLSHIYDKILIELLSHNPDSEMLKLKRLMEYTSSINSILLKNTFLPYFLDQREILSQAMHEKYNLYISNQIMLSSYEKMSIKEINESIENLGKELVGNDDVFNENRSKIIKMIKTYNDYKDFYYIYGNLIGFIEKKIYDLSLVICNVDKENINKARFDKEKIQKSIEYIYYISYISRSIYKKKSINSHNQIDISIDMNSIINSYLNIDFSFLQNQYNSVFTKEISDYEYLIDVIIKEKNIKINKFLIKTAITSKDSLVLSKCIELYIVFVKQISDENNEIVYSQIKEDLFEIINQNQFMNENMKEAFIFVLVNWLLEFNKKTKSFTENQSLIEDSIFYIYGYNEGSNRDLHMKVSNDIKYINNFPNKSEEICKKYEILSSVISDNDNNLKQFVLKEIFSILHFVYLYLIDDKQYQLDEIQVIDDEKQNSNKEEKPINMDIILYSLYNIITKLKSELVKYNELSYLNLYIYSYIQKFIIHIFSYDIIFKSFTKTPELLKKVIIEFTSIPHFFINTSEQQEHNEQIKIFYEKSKEEIGKNIGGLLELSSILSKITIIFSEKTLYSFFFIKNHSFIKNLSCQMENKYKSSIMNEECLPSLITQLTKEDIELTEIDNLLKQILGEEIVSYLSFPKSLYEFFQNYQDEIRFNIKMENKDFYYYLISFYYIWKTIISKIEYGFKLYTSNKSYVDTIEKYKVLLKFLVGYFQRNSHFYEMFLLTSISILQLCENNLNIDIGINREVIINDMTNQSENDFIEIINEDVKQSQDSQMKNRNSKMSYNIFIFITSILYKYIKVFPSLVRFWNDQLNGKIKYTFKNIIHKLILPQMTKEINENFNNNKPLLQSKGIIIKDIKTSSIEFLYNLNDEIKMTFVIKIPPNFPLKKLEISFETNAHILNHKILNLKMNLNQAVNLSIDNLIDNLISWIDNCKQYILGNTEPCPICYFYLHNTDKALPTLACRKCKNIFHSLCIKEWFESSAANTGKTTCPMCRSEWIMKNR